MDDRSSTAALAPNCTLYINNLNDKLKKDFLKQMLYMMCSQYGRIVDLIAIKGPKHKGQAFVVFQEVSESTLALKNLNGKVFFGKPMKIAYAKTKSRKILQLEGTLGDETTKYEPASKRMHRMNQEENSIESKTLLVENLPNETTQESLSLLFHQYPGYLETRMAPGKTSVAFVEFSSESQASTAKSVMNHFKLDPTHELKISFARK